MKTCVSLLTISFCLLAISPDARGHGFGISHIGNQIVADSGNAFHPDLFTHEFIQQSATEQTIYHGMFSKTASPTAPKMTFGGSDTFRFDLLGPLLYSDGLIVTPAVDGLTLDVDHNQAPNQHRELTGSDSGVTAGFPVAATSAHDVNWTVSGATVPDGAYAIKYRIQGFAGGDTQNPYEPKDVVLVFDTEGAVWGAGQLGELADAQELLYDFAFASNNVSNSAGVPEPTSFALGLLGLGMLRVRRKRQRRLAG